MDILATIWVVTVGVLLVLLGLNALIIVHEFGHFIVARLCGVRCDKFYIWFDFWGLKFFKFKWGDTEYGLGLFPLGGYLKMLGQEDDPGAIRTEIERAKQPVETGGLTPPAHGTDNTAEAKPSIFAPDSYLSKSVPQRLAIIVAGVIMNFLFAIICAAGAYMIGVEELTSAVGNVIPGSPAWEAGLRVGDKITAIDGKSARTFSDVLMKMVEGNKTVQLDIERQGKPMTIDVLPRRRVGDHTPKIGIGSLPTLELFSGSISPLYEKYYSVESLETLKKHSKTHPLQIEKVDGQIVDNYADYQDIQLKKIGQPVICTFNGMDVEIPAIPMREIPVRFKMGEIVSVLPGSDAAKQGIVSGDILVAVDGDTEIDPLKLPQILLQKVNDEQKNVELVVKKASGEEQPLTIALEPIRIMPELSYMSMRDPLGSTALGVSWNVEPVIADVKESEISSEQPLPVAGDKIVGVEFVNSVALLRQKTSFSEVTNEKGIFIRSIGNKIGIPYIFAYLLQDAEPRMPKKGEKEKTLSVRLNIESPDGNMKIVSMPILESPDWFHSERGYFLKMEQTIFKATGFGEALSFGTVRTIDNSLLVYKSVNALINGTVSTKALYGPVGIVNIMYRIAQGGWNQYLMLLCLIGANLAVINLFPIPPLDGGHVVFLLYEGIVRRPPNELVQVILSYLGLFLIILLLLWTVSLDLTCIPRM